MHTNATTFIQDLAVIMVISGVITVIFHRLKQPVVVGYIIAGIIIGPYTPPFSYIQDETTIKTLAELGVIFLMFFLGLEFDLHKLKKVGVGAFVATLIEVLLMAWVGYEIGLMFKWSFMDSIFLGAILAISSTSVVIKALEGFGMRNEKLTQFIFGVLVIEDVLAIVILALLSGIAIDGTFHAKDVVITTTKLSLFITISLISGIFLVPKFLSYIAKFKNKEMLLISILGLCFGFCLLVIKFNYSVALGAFIIGAIVAESHQNDLIEQLITPLRDMFSAIFFVSIGLLFNPKIMFEYAIPILVITLVVLVGKVFFCTLSTFISGKSIKKSMYVGMTLAQLGEFSFIIASLGISLHLTSDFLFPIAVAVSLMTTFLTPYLIKYSHSIANYIGKIFPNKPPSFFRIYTILLRKIKNKEIEAKIKKIIYLSVFKVVVNILVIATVFFYSFLYFSLSMGWFFR